jgi:luciferase family oxidoreductase group 1
MPPLKLSILDQSPVISGHTPAQAVAETIKLAQAAEKLGYYRYWLAEHHALAALADPCPEILLTRIAAATSTIRVGTGGILLPYYSPLKVAEQFRMLEALFPQRIDLGVGHAVLQHLEHGRSQQHVAVVAQFRHQHVAHRGRVYRVGNHDRTIP